MNTTMRRSIMALVVLAALAAGFGLARLSGGPDPAAHADDHEGETHDHAAEGAAPQAADAHDHDHEDHDEHGSDGRVALTRGQVEASGIRVVAVGRGGGGETRLSGRVEPAVGARAAVAAAIAGRVERVLVAPGTPVRRGQPLAVIVSGEAATLRAGAEAARADAEAARLAYRRDRALVEQGVVARQDLEASRARSLAADAAARAAAAQAEAAGSPSASGRVTVASPMDGIVGAVQATPGGFVGAGDVVAQVADPARTELVFSAPPELAAQVAPGAPIEVAGPEGGFPAVVIGAAADVREQGGRTIVRARAESGALPPAGTPVSGVLATSVQDGALAVPADALQTVDGRAVVFVAEEGGFRAAPVLAGRRAGGRVEILEGLSGGERIAAANAFLLKAELAKGEAAHDH